MKFELNNLLSGFDFTVQTILTFYHIGNINNIFYFSDIDNAIIDNIPVFEILVLHRIRKKKKH